MLKSLTWALQGTGKMMTAAQALSLSTGALPFIFIHYLVDNTNSLCKKYGGSKQQPNFGVHPLPDKVFDGEPSRTEKGCASLFHLANTQQNAALGKGDSGGSS